MKPLIVQEFPLAGQALIEASAGTGKTYTITGLYNRLILGHRPGEPSATPLGCDQILVVTFTRAATEELRGRIRQRLRDTFEDILRLENQQSAEDPLLSIYLQDIAAWRNTEPDALRQTLKPWLQTNLSLMDEAAIFTIHGFCQRMLKQFAFDSGVVFSAELVLDSESYLQQACEDIWRQRAYHLSAEQGRYLLSRYSGPDQLLAKVKSRITRPDMTLQPPLPGESFEQLWASSAAAFSAIGSLCQQNRAGDIAQLIADSGLDKRSYSSRNAPSWIAQAYGYFSGPFYLPPPEALQKLTPAAMTEKLKSGELPAHPLFAAIDGFLQLAQQLSLLLELAWMDAIKARYFELLEKAGALTPDDLLRLLQAALNTEQGEALAAQIRRLYPLAMIDEFQDTDPQQYDIFNRIYPQAENTQAAADGSVQPHGLIMIGDPKQAIYGFRGADIFTYITARRRLADDQRFTLNVNWRSHSRLVAGVNQLFARHTSPFIYDRDIEFIQVSAGGRHDAQAFRVNGEAQVPLQLWYDGNEYSRPRAQLTAAQQCAAQIAALLQGAGQLGEKAVQARDIAVLVRSRKQAGWIRDALQAQGVGSVFLTRDSVFKSREATDLFHWLQAVAHPADERMLRSALATDTQGYSAAQLDHLLNNEQAWEVVLGRHQHYHQLWNRRGIMAAVMQWLEDDDRAQRLRALEDGERRLTNLMHLGELLQSASRRLRGHEALLRWLGEHIFSDESGGDEAQLRLESDANLVTIVTIHKSKGLQYPLVFLPYLWDDQFTNGRGDVQYFREGQGIVLDLQPDDEARVAAERDRLAEDLRLLYVALTRAEQGCFVWLMDALDGRSKKEKKSYIAGSALGYLLQLDKNPDWQALQSSSTDELLIGAAAPWPAYASQPLSNGTDAGALRAATIQPRSRDHWRVSSYSQLTADYADAAHHPDQQQSALQNIESEALLRRDEAGTRAGNFTAAEFSLPGTQPFDEQHPALTFAKGANAGTCLHAIFEHWDFQDHSALSTMVRTELAHYGLLAADDAAQSQQINGLSQWLTAVVQSPLMDAQQSSFTLADIAPGQRLDEMEFYLPVAGLHPQQVDALLAAGKHTDRRFHFDPLTGYLKGFIDLIFCHKGRYYVADYKSNHLGFSLADYAPAALQTAMRDHRYDLQAWIYTLALDQLLRQRLSDYEPSQHLGGVYYFFLRGMHLGQAAPLFPVPLASESSLAGTTDSATQGDLFSAADEALQLPPGVYYHAASEPQLQRWRQVFLSTEVEA